MANRVETAFSGRASRNGRDITSPASQELVEGAEQARHRDAFAGRVSTIESSLGLQDGHVAEAIRALGAAVD